MLLREGDSENVTEGFSEAPALPRILPQALQAIAESCGGAEALPLSGPDDGAASTAFKDFADEFILEEWLKTNPHRRAGLQATLAGWQPAEEDDFGAEGIPL